MRTWRWLRDMAPVEYVLGFVIIVIVTFVLTLALPALQREANASYDWCADRMRDASTSLERLLVYRLRPPRQWTTCASFLP